VVLYKQYIFLSKIELKIEYAINYPIFFICWIVFGYDRCLILRLKKNKKTRAKKNPLPVFAYK
jgi:hypothetical protein